MTGAHKAPTAPQLSRSNHPGATPAPTRIVHLGLGAFHRAHQAWYTQNSVDAAEWGIAAFTGRSADVAEHLEPQGGLYTLIERGDDDDSFDVISSIVQVESGANLAVLIELLARPEIAIISLTITEAGYRLNVDGGPNLDDPAVALDVQQLKALFASGGDLVDTSVSTTLARLLLGLEARRRASVPPLAIVPCDNLPQNGPMMRRALEQLALMVDAGLAGWLSTGVTFVSTSVDRITPRATEADRRAVTKGLGWRDESPVVCEPFSDWVLSGDFPSGRPAWQTAGARFVTDIEPWEHRKLWMLNGAHTALAASGLLRGHAVVSEAIADPVCLALVTALWVEDKRQLSGVEVEHYAAQLLARFRNPRIEHRLEQIAADTLTKLTLRIAPVAERERAAGRSAEGCAAVIANWILAVSMGLMPAPVKLDAESSVLKLVSALGPKLGDDLDFCRTVAAALHAQPVLRPPVATG
jgi:fructuronate reductase